MRDRRHPRLRASWPASVSRPVATPIQPSVVYAADDADALDAQYEGRVSGYTYAREGHPNAQVLAGLIDGMEGASGGIVVGSGMAAVTLALLGTLQAGDHVVAADQLYGRSLRLLREELPRLGIAVTLADPADLDAVQAALRPDTRLILVETVSNPTLRVADVDGIIRLAGARGVRVAIDNTFATPRGLRPLERGADIVVHSITKMLAGHSDATLGYVAARDPALAERLATLAATLGPTPSPFDCWLAERGVYTFGLRHERAAGSAARLADALAGAAGVRRVIYPVRADHPDHARAAALLDVPGGTIVSFEIEGGREAANTLIRAARGINFAPTLGDVATTLSHPVSSSHRSMAPEDRAARGISEGLFRVSVGCEPHEDLIAAFLDAVRASQDR